MRNVTRPICIILLLVACGIAGAQGNPTPFATIRVSVHLAPPPNVDFSQAGYSIGEGDGNVTITVAVDAPPGGTCSVDYHTVDGSAVAGLDYASTSGTLTFTSSETSQSFEVSILDDGDFDEGSEFFTINLTNPAGCELAGTNNPALVTITDNDTPGSLATVYVDFDRADTPPQDGVSPATAYGTFGRGLTAVETSGFIKVNGSASDRDSEWTGTISTAMTIQADPAGTIRIGVWGAGSSDASKLSDEDAVAGSGEASLGDLLGILRGNLATTSVATAEENGEDPESGEASGEIIRDRMIHEPVMPFAMAGDGLRAAKADSVLAVRLRSGDADGGAIDPDTIWGEVFESTGGAAIEWRPVEDGDQRDVWVLFRPDETWYLDDLITLSAGAQTIDGDEVASTTYEFQVESEGNWLDRLLNPAEALWQPRYNQDFNADNLDLTLESNDEATVAPAGETVSATPLNQGIDMPLAIGPEQVYEKPQRVWLPVPEGIDPNAVRVYYYHATGDDKGWYPAGNVEGWMVPDSTLHLRTNGTTYIGFLVRHAGIVQLGLPKQD